MPSIGGFLESGCAGCSVQSTLRSLSA